MLLTIYWIGLAMVLVLFILAFTFESEYEKKSCKKAIGLMSMVFSFLFMVCLMLFYMYNIYILALKYDFIMNMVSLNFVLLFMSFILFSLIKDEKWKYFDLIRKACKYILISITIVSLFLFTIFMGIFLIKGFSYTRREDRKYEEYAYSIDILEIKEVPYINISNNMWNISSTPINSYYYEMTTKNGNTTTKILDGYEHYIEKDEDNKYINNPHIEVYYIIQPSYNIYTRKAKKKVVNESYIICIPENLIYNE